MKNRKTKTIFALVFVLLLNISAIMATAPTASSQTAPTRKTAAYLSVAPNLIGLDQQLTVNLWVYPAPATLSFAWYHKAFEGITVTFTRPDGSKDSFMPVDASGGFAPGATEMIGAIWFNYKPSQIGTWKVQFSMPQQTIGEGSDAVY